MVSAVEAESTRSSSTRQGFSDDVLNVLLPEELEWERMVMTYPIPSLAVALTAGFFIGSRHGRFVVGALGGFLSGRVEHAVNSLLSD
ncbi:MAG: hypothetical protein K8J08_14385 [Thermoanaerobaculia bacterium]|nr:hypothetical protein [Thermoanaerobaculia bacterium]